ncbi:MAG TPA: hypothetical protein VK722_19780 [Candidatus Aquilonibacter sp.]|jgi:hypothetical protein|nr:hypothetical protein [Candidatus Aquilonibacter sp.]
MKQRFTALSVLAGLLVVASVAGTVFAQDATDKTAVPRYAVRLPHPQPATGEPVTPLTTWNGSFVYNKVTYKYTMVGTAPTTGKSTTVPVFIIPIALSYKSGTTTTTFSPLTKLSNGLTAVSSTTESPIFQKMDWVTPEGTDLGTTQYEDAFQRGNFWTEVSAAPGYHLLLGTPRVAPVQTIVVPAADGSIGNEFGVKVGLADIDWFDSELQGILTKLKANITPNTFPIFITYNAYLTEGTCCIGGYHSAYGATGAMQAYAHFTYIGTPGVFAQDVSALSHEAGEWMDDPLVTNGGNPVECGILEVGDPEEGFNEDGALYGAFPYTLNGSTYHLQDLVYLEYFGAPNTTSVDGGKESFHDNPFGLGICNNGG